MCTRHFNDSAKDKKKKKKGRQQWIVCDCTNHFICAVTRAQTQQCDQFLCKDLLCRQGWDIHNWIVGLGSNTFQRESSITKYFRTRLCRTLISGNKHRWTEVTWNNFTGNCVQQTPPAPFKVVNGHCAGWMEVQQRSKKDALEKLLFCTFLTGKEMTALNSSTQLHFVQTVQSLLSRAAVNYKRQANLSIQRRT